MSALFQPLQAGALLLPNRILMAPLTRCRASADNIPTELMATHYAQRASAPPNKPARQPASKPPI